MNTGFRFTFIWAHCGLLCWENLLILSKSITLLKLFAQLFLNVINGLTTANVKTFTAVKLLLVFNSITVNYIEIWGYVWDHGVGYLRSMNLTTVRFLSLRDWKHYVENNWMSWFWKCQIQETQIFQLKLSHTKCHKILA